MVDPPPCSNSLSNGRRENAAGLQRHGRSPAPSTAAVSAIEEISTIVAQISDRQATIASAVEEQIATTSEMFRSVQEAAGGTGEIAANITGVSRLSGRHPVAISGHMSTMAKRSPTKLAGNFRHAAIRN